MCAAFDDDTRSWLIFDTCTRPAYYQDLHNILAAPAGHVLRYEYKEKYLTPEVRGTLSAARSQPKSVLLAYVQQREFTRGANAVFTLPTFEGGLWLATRFAEMMNIVREADRYFFDLSLGAYPQNQGAAHDFFSAAFQSANTPPQAWVAFASRDRVMQLEGGSEDENFSHIAETLAVPPSQFAGDVFWRVLRLTRAGEGVAVKFEPEVDKFGEQVRHVRSAAQLKDAAEYRLEISTLRSPASRTGGAPTSFKIEATSDNPDHVRLVGSGVIDVRQYTAAIIEVTTAPIVSIKDSIQTELTLVTTPLDEDWPQGPQVRLRLKVTRQMSRMVLGIGSFALGLACATPGIWGLSNGYVLAGFIGLVSGGALMALGASLWTGKLSTR
jgi:hypothetical protein